MKPTAKRYLITVGVGLLIALAIFLLGFTSGEPVLTCLCDGFSISGVCLAGAGGLVFVSNEGVFRMLVYSVSLFFQIRRRDGKGRKYKDYYEYKTAKEEKQGSFAHLLLVGLAFLAIGCILLIWA